MCVREKEVVYVISFRTIWLKWFKSNLHEGQNQYLLFLVFVSVCVWIRVLHYTIWYRQPVSDCQRQTPMRKTENREGKKLSHSIKYAQRASLKYFTGAHADTTTHTKKFLSEIIQNMNLFFPLPWILCEPFFLCTLLWSVACSLCVCKHTKIAKDASERKVQRSSIWIFMCLIVNIFAIGFFSLSKA